MKDELGEKITIEFAALRPKKPCSYLTDENEEYKKKQQQQQQNAEGCHIVKTQI